MRRLLTTAAALAAFVATPAVAQVYVTVDAFNNSTSGSGSALIVTGLIAGQTYRVLQNPNDLWSAGALPRWSDANGLTSNRYANGIDDSGQPVGTLIGQNFGSWTQGGLTAAYGSLVDTTNPLAFQFVGAGLSTFYTVGSTGTLSLSYFDSNNFDNTGSITFKLAAVPEPASWALMIMGFGAVGAALRRRSAPRPALV